MIAIALHTLREAAAHRPQGYYAACVTAGRVEGDALLLTPEAYSELRRQYSPPNISQSLVTPEEKARRLAICEKCEFFIPTERICGKCNCPMDIKAGRQSAQCPAGKWISTNALSAIE